jgi:hypothetical protein
MTVLEYMPPFLLMLDNESDADIQILRRCCISIGYVNLLP